MAVGWQRWWGPYPAIDTRTGPSLLLAVTQCRRWLTFSAYSRLLTEIAMLSLTMSGTESSPSATATRAMARVDEVTILMSSWCLCCHWGLAMVTGVTGVCSLAHWEYNTESGTEELWTQSGSPGQWPGRVSLQSLGLQMAQHCLPGEKHWQHCALLPFLHFSFCNSN